MKNNTTSVTEATTNDNNSDRSRSSSGSIVIGSGSGISNSNSNNGIRNITQLMPSVIGNLSNSYSLATTSTTTTTAKTYPSINSAYWQPSPYPTPYVVPERKLFVGMLNKKLNENEVRKLFEPFGTIEECTVLRDQNGQSKGCAFVTFSTKQSAISAIKVTLNQNKIMDGCTSPLVVKFADTQKEKEQKKIQQIQANLWNLASNINIPLGQTATTVSTPILPNPPQQASPVLGSDAITPSSLQFLQQLQAVGLQQQILQGLSAQTGGADASAAAAAFNVQNLAAIAAMTQPSLTASAAQPGSAQLTNAAALLCLLGKTANSGSDANSLTSAYMSSAAGLPQFGSTALSTSPLASVALSTAAAVAAGKQIEDLMNRTSICLMCEGVLKHAGSSGRAQGPEGCNLFIYHLPQEFTDTDLASTFLPFGNVISAKVFIDKQTNLSKCFGFVSFDNAESAQVAIKAMHGFQVGTKRLKVQLKKPKDASKPY
ncbi:CUGBP Elav-like family member 2 isoform X8 [Episyrphus balteatus]|uniref:CUGBP Elav-like family member 2 isoform X8 n=1 Tax=Episyrphus balteatus TaxID=286459 RepID=UPI002485CDB7|nr:CUGBP Elav-like family member 2 isoform X8 [Episyrphus balteatus]